jgi:hypothetical protein
MEFCPSTAGAKSDELVIQYFDSKLSQFITIGLAGIGF